MDENALIDTSERLRQRILAYPEDRQALFVALGSFRQYGITAHQCYTHSRRDNLFALPIHQQEMLTAAPFHMLRGLDRLDDAIQVNADIASEIVTAALNEYDVEPTSTDWHGAATLDGIDHAQSIFGQLYREWSVEGAGERESCYRPVIEAIEHRYACVTSKSSVRILNPGAGLGRFVHDLCRLGYFVEGNDNSYYQSMASNWIRNHTQLENQHDLHPFISDFSNVVEREHQLLAVKIPDIQPVVTRDADLKELSLFTRSDFVFEYGAAILRETFDVVATIFFLDTAPNVITYIETIRHCLKPGGVWINLGPLKWHHAAVMQPEIGSHSPGPLELTNEELLLLVQKMGFEFEEQQIRNGVGYAQNPNSLLQHQYSNSYWVAKKVAIP